MKNVINAIRKIARKNPHLKRAAYKYKFKHHQPSWDKILEKDSLLWQTALKNIKPSKKVLIATSVGSHLASTRLESMLSMALTLRDVEAEILLCDMCLPACLGCWYELFPNRKHFAKHGPLKDLCKTCFNPAYKMYKPLGLKINKYSEFLTKEDIKKAEEISVSVAYQEIGKYLLQGLSVGEHALAGALRFCARGDLNGEPYAEEILRRFFNASILTVFMMQNILRKNKYDCVVFHHGIYVPQGLIGEVCRASNVRVVNWNPGYKKHTFIFSHNDSYHRTMMNEPINSWDTLEWRNDLESKLDKYLKSRWYGTEDWIWFHEKPELNLEKIAEQFNIDFSKPCVGLLTSVVWDAVLHYPSNAFDNMIDWIVKTIDYFRKRQDLQLIIRIHPAEVSGGLPSRQRIMDEIKKRYNFLPNNIKIIPPQSRVSTYAVMSKCDSVIIYNTKSGIELTATGIPVIVAGEAWIRNKGFAFDVDNEESYFNLLEKLPLRKKMSEENILKAKKYAYHFFFRRFIPVSFMKPGHYSSVYKIELDSLSQLLPEKNLGLDIICDGILKGTDFIYPADKPNK